jgi:hypothetical protein
VGSIGIPCTDTGRYSAFSDSLANLEKPPGTHIDFAVCNSRQKARNELARQMLLRGDEWLFFVDDDQAFAPDLLNRLLSHEKEIVAALCLRRDEPYAPFCFTDIYEDGTYQPIDLREHAVDELVSVMAVGTGAMLIRREVFEELDDPWFPTEETSEDMLFCREARWHGFDIYCDLGARLGHMTTAVVWPSSTEKGWAAGIVVSGETTFLRPFSGVPQPIEV